MGNPKRLIAVPLVGGALLLASVLLVPLFAAAGGSAAPGEALVGLPARALDAYRSTDGWCAGLRWELVAAIGEVESGHGTHGGAVIGDDGIATPWIFGPALDGTGRTRRLPIAEWIGWWGLRGPWQQAVGPMQFLAGTFTASSVDGDGDGITNPHDIDDAAPTAANYLCADGDIADERTVVLRYNNSVAYASEVIALADRIATPAFRAGAGWGCPIAGPVSFTDTWGAPRPGGRSHRGVDMFAALGTPVVAPVDGRVEYRSNAIGGPSFHLWGDDGSYYYGTHLSRYGAVAGHLRAGTIVGYVGATGNAAGTPPHLHFEIHPGRASGEPPAPVNPTATVAAACEATRIGVAITGGD